MVLARQLRSQGKVEEAGRIEASIRLTTAEKDGILAQNIGEGEMLAVGSVWERLGGRNINRRPSEAEFNAAKEAEIPLLRREGALGRVGADYISRITPAEFDIGLIEMGRDPLFVRSSMLSQPLTPENILAKQEQRHAVEAQQQDEFGVTPESYTDIEDGADEALDNLAGDLAESDEEYYRIVEEFKVAQGADIRGVGPGAVRVVHPTYRDSPQLEAVQELVGAPAEELIEEGKTTRMILDMQDEAIPPENVLGKATIAEAKVEAGNLQTVAGRIANAVGKMAQDQQSAPTSNSGAMPPLQNAHAWEDGVDALQSWPFGETPKALITRHIGKMDDLNDVLELNRLDLLQEYRASELEYGQPFPRRYSTRL